jgi:hypothetical protein
MSLNVIMDLWKQHVHNSSNKVEGKISLGSVVFHPCAYAPPKISLMVDFHTNYVRML